MKKLTLLTTMITLLLMSALQGQVVVSSSTSATPDASSVIDIQATDGGMLIPRMTQTQRDAITNPATGLLIYQTDNTPGFYYNAGTAASPSWIRIGRGGDDWSVTGNAGTSVATDFIGTTDNVDFAARTDNTERLRVESDGQIVVGNGYTAPPTNVKFTTRGNATNPIALYGYSGVSGGIGLYGEDGGDGVGVYGTVATDGLGVFGIADDDEGFGVWAQNDGSSGTALIGLGNGLTTASYIASGTGGSLTGYHGVYGKGTNSTEGTGVIGVGNNGSSYTILTAGSGIAGTGSQFGVYGYTNNSSGAGVIGQNGDSDGWAGDFQGNLKMGTSTSNTHRFWGDLRSGSTSDNHRIIPNTGSWGYVGTGGLYWYEMYAVSYFTVSRRELKRDIEPLNNITRDIVMHDIENMKPSLYKFKLETDNMEPGNEAKYRPNTHLGLIIDESPDYIQDNTFSGIDIYALGTLALAGVKINREDIKEIQEKISDFGSIQMQGTEIWVNFADDFSSKLSSSDIPVVTVTSNNPNVTLSISQKTSNGFRVLASKTISNLSFDWIAMAKVDPNNKQLSDKEIMDLKKQYQMIVSESIKQQMRDWAKERDSDQSDTNERTEKIEQTKRIEQATKTAESKKEILGTIEDKKEEGNNK